MERFGQYDSERVIYRMAAHAVDISESEGICVRTGCPGRVWASAVARIALLMTTVVGDN